MTWLVWENLVLYLHSSTWVHRNFYHVAWLRIIRALPPLPYMCPLNFLSRGWFEKLWSSISTPLNASTELFITRLVWECLELSPLPYIGPLNFLSRGWYDKLWRYTSTPLHVPSELFITWLVWEIVELYLHSPTYVPWTIYHVAVLRRRGAVSPLPYMCPLIFLSRG